MTVFNRTADDVCSQAKMSPSPSTISRRLGWAGKIPRYLGPAFTDVTRRTSHWDGVRNAVAKNYMKNDMRVGDGVGYNEQAGCRMAQSK